MKAWIALGTWAALSILPLRAAAEPPDAFPLSGLSGTWIGKHTVEQIGECRGPGESGVILTLDVTDDGSIEVRIGGPRLGVGTVSQATWEVTLRDDRAFARCGEKEREYERVFTGSFRQDGDDLRLELEGEDAPCPPRCRFLDRYRVKKQDIEVRSPGGSAGRDAPARAE